MSSRHELGENSFVANHVNAKRNRINPMYNPRPLSQHRFLRVPPNSPCKINVKCGVPREDLEKLYVERRDDVLRRIGNFYGVEAFKCKYAVLIVLNGGSPMAWIEEVSCTRNRRRRLGSAASLHTPETCKRRTFGLKGMVPMLIWTGIVRRL